MKILLCNRDARAHTGGDMTQLYAYQKELRGLGHEADYMWQGDVNMRGYDMAILFHINFDWTIRHWQSAVRSGVPYCIMSIYYPLLYIGTNHDQMYEVLKGAKKVFVNSQAEGQELRNEFPLIETTVIDNGVDPTIFNKTPVFGSDWNHPRSYVMAASARGDKGEFLVRNACEELGLPFYEVKGLTQLELAKAYREAKVYVCASDSERNNIMILEAAACGASVVDSIHNRAHKLHNFPSVNPQDPVALKEAIQRAWDTPADFSDRVKTWKQVVEEILTHL